ncbi:MAG: hypothetical protein V5A72_02810 [Candidatus Nanohaloarchaea archaeon]
MKEHLYNARVIYQAFELKSVLTLDANNDFKLSTKKNLLILASAAFISLILLFVISNSLSHTEISSEVRKNSTEYMLQGINSSLMAIGCKGKDHSVNNDKSEICFECRTKNACFRYGIVERSSGAKMNPKGGKYLEGGYTISERYSFQTSGITDILECKFDDFNVSCWNNVEVTIKDENSKYERFYASLPNGMLPQDLAGRIKQVKGYECIIQEEKLYTKYTCGDIVFEHLNQEPKKIKIGSGREL